MSLSARGGAGAPASAEANTVQIYPSVLSQRHASIQLPSMPVHRSAIQHHADNIFIGCVAPSHEQGDIVAVDVADVLTYIVPFPLLHLHCCRSCITFEVAFGKLDEKLKSENMQKEAVF